MSETASQLGRYSLVRRLAAGGMGEVFLAREHGLRGLERAVVIKRLLPELADGPEAVARFLDEARIIAQLSHPNIARLHELGQDGDSYFLVMEYVPGQDLQHVLLRAHEAGVVLPPRFGAQVIAEVASALYHAHTACDVDGAPLGVVHRDVSPHNVMLSVHGDVKLMDFGVAKMARQEARTRTGAVVGKFAYMAPEQLQGHVDPRSDVFAAGVMLWEATLQRRLFRGRDEADTIERVRTMPVPPPRALEPGYPAELEEIVLGALERDVERRTASAGTLEGQLRHWLRASGDELDRDMIGGLVRVLFPEAIEATPTLRTRPGRSPYAAGRRPAAPSPPPPVRAEATPHTITIVPPTRRAVGAVARPAIAWYSWTLLVVGAAALVVLALALTRPRATSTPPPSPGPPRAAPVAPSPPSVEAPPVEAPPVVQPAPEPPTTPPRVDAPPPRPSRPAKRVSPARPRLAYAQPTPGATAHIAVASAPGREAIVIDGVELAMTPYNLWLRPGSYELRLVASDGGVTRVRLRLPANTTTLCQKRDGALSCAEPWAPRRP